jgi:hypothetical protein
VFLLLAVSAEAGEVVCSDGGTAAAWEKKPQSQEDGRREGTIWMHRTSAREPLAPSRTVPGPPKPVPTAGLKLEGIIAIGEKAMAIINKGFYRKGDCILGFLITEIQRDRVLVERGARKAYLIIR